MLKKYKPTKDRAAYSHTIANSESANSVVELITIEFVASPNKRIARSRKKKATSVVLTEEILIAFFSCVNTL